MGFRIHRGAWQFKDSSNRFVTKYKLDTTGRLKETDADGNLLDDAFMDRTASPNIPSEYLTQTEGDGRYFRKNAYVSTTGSVVILSGSQTNHGFEVTSSVATYRSDAPYWRLWQPQSQEQIVAVNGGEVRLSYDGTTKIKTQSGGVDFLNGNLTSVNAIIFNDNIRFLDAGNDSNLRLRFGDTNNGQLQFEKSDGTRTGTVYWDGNGSQFGLLNKDGQWAVRTTEYDTSLYYDGSRKLRTTSTGVYVEGDATFANWVRVKNNDGLYFQDRGGGWYMTDGTFIRAYNNKSIYTTGEIQASRLVDASDTNYRIDPAGTSYLNDVRTNIIYDRNNTNYYLHLDSNSHLNTVYAFRYYDKDNGSYYLEPASSSRLVKLDVDEYVQAAHGKPRNNLGSPTVTEMALFESQFTCKTDLSNDYNDMSDLTFWVQQNSGDAWTEITVSDDQKRRFLRTNNSNVVIPNGAYKFRVEFNGRHYTFANAIYFYWSSNSHNSQVHIWKKRCSDGQWLQHTSATNTVSSWPGHLYLPFSTIPWHETNTTSTGHFTHVRVEFTPNWSTGSNSHRDINLQGGQVWGGYPSGKRTPHRIDHDGNYIFPYNLYTDGSLNSGNKLLKTSDILATDITSHDWNDFISGDSEFSIRSATGASGSNRPSTYNYGLVMSAHESGGAKLQIYGPHNGSENGTGLWFRTGWGGDFDPWAEIWHSNNDGSGSGLDADLLDGQQGSHYLNYNNLTNKPSTFTPSSHSHNFITNTTSYVVSGGMQSWDRQESTPDLNPTTDWFTALRIGHGHPVDYYSNTLAMQMTGGDLGRIYTRTISNGTKQSWNKYWHDGDFSVAAVNNGNTAYGWGNHADAGYLTSEVPQTLSRSNGIITLSDGGGSTDLDNRYFTEAESNTRFAYKAGSNSQDFYVDDLFYDAWLRNHTNDNGLYWSRTGWHLYIGSNDTMHFRSGNNGAAKLLLWTGSTQRNAIYNNSSNEIGFLNTSGSWSFRVNNTGSAEVYQDLSVAGDIYSGTTRVISGGRWVGDNSGLVGPQGPQGDRGPAGSDGRDGSNASISFTNQESGQSSSVTSITFNRGEAQFTMADGSVMTIGNARMG